MKSKSNLYINVEEAYNKKYMYRNNKNKKFNSLIFNKSLTTNTSGTTFWTPNNTLENNKIKKNIFSLKSKMNPKLSSLSIFTPESKIYKNNFFLPHIKTPIETIEILKKADKIIKYRQGKYTGSTLKQTKSTVIKKSNEICLKNFLITQIKYKRDEIDNIQKEITANAENADYQYHLDYKNFLNFKEDVNQKIKSLEDEYMNIKQINKVRENILREESLKNQSLERNIENITKQIILLQNYGKFLHIVFESPFFLEEINKYDLKEKRYLKIYKQILKMIEKNKKIFEDNSVILNDSEEFMKIFEYFEKKIVNNVKMKNDIKEEIALGYINNIKDLINSEDRKKILDIIDERKKLIKREKYSEYIYKQKIEAEKRKFKTNSSYINIVIKGRKAFRDIPIIKKKKVNVKKNINNELETFEYLNYSSDN